MRPGRHSLDNPEEQRAREKLRKKPDEKLPGKEVVTIKSRGKFSYNGKGA